MVLWVLLKDRHDARRLLCVHGRRLHSRTAQEEDLPYIGLAGDPWPGPTSPMPAQLTCFSCRNLRCRAPPAPAAGPAFTHPKVCTSPWTCVGISRPPCSQLSRHAHLTVNFDGLNLMHCTGADADRRPDLAAWQVDPVRVDDQLGVLSRV